MEFKQILRRVIVVIILIFVCFVLQISIFSRLQLAGVVPNILITVTATFGFMKGQKKGMFVGFFCGLLLDLFLGFYFGVLAFVYMFIGYLNGFFRRLFFGEDLRLPMVLIGASDIIYGYIMYFIKYIVSQNSNISFYTIHIILPEAVYTVLVSIVIYYLILQIDLWMDRTDKKRGYGRVDGNY